MYNAIHDGNIPDKLTINIPSTIISYNIPYNILKYY